MALSTSLKKILSRRVIFPFIFDEMIYIVLPVFVILGITYHIDGKISPHILAIKEWSFANVLLCGVAIKRIFKVSNKRIHARNYEKYIELELSILLIIASSLVLSLIILVQDFSASITFSAHHLASAQLSIFIVGSMSVLYTYKVEDDIYKYIRTIPDTETLRRYFLAFKAELAQIERQVEDHLHALDNLPVDVIRQQAYSDYELDNIDDLQNCFERISLKVIKAKGILLDLECKIKQAH